MESANNPSRRRGGIYTLVQSETGNNNKLPTIIKGNGSELSVIDRQKGRCKRKVITQTMVLKLIDIALQKGDEEYLKSYWNTWHCLNRVTTVDGKVHGDYCKNKFCILCSAIRKAEIINKYHPILKTWEEPYFVTLTRKACKAKDLKSTVNEVSDVFKKIVAKYRKRHSRGTGQKLMGIKSLECNYNPIDKTYNPHLHIIVPDKQTANILMTEWLKAFGVFKASGSGQDKKLITDMEFQLVELIKYGSKIFTEPDVKRKSKARKGDRDIYVKALYNIFDVMWGKRLFDRFGFNLPKSQKPEAVPYKIVTDYEEWLFDLKSNNWLHSENELVLTDYVMSAELEELLEYHINTEKE